MQNDWHVAQKTDKHTQTDGLTYIEKRRDRHTSETQTETKSTGQRKREQKAISNVREVVLGLVCVISCKPAIDVSWQVLPLMMAE